MTSQIIRGHNKIFALTAEQTAAVTAVRRSYLSWTLGTERADRAEAEKGVIEAYEAADLSPPKSIIWRDGPEASIELANLLSNPVRDKIWTHTKNKIDRQLDEYVSREVASKIYALSDTYIRNQIWNGTWDSIQDHFQARVSRKIWEQIKNRVRPVTLDRINQRRTPSFYAALKALGLDDLVAPLQGIMRVSRSAGWWWAFEDSVVLSERPTVMNRDAQGRLHCDDGPSLSYRDGFAIYAVHGTRVRVPAWVIERPQDITPALIDAETNAEVRRVMIMRYKRGEEINGAAAYVRDAGGDLLDDDPRWGRLYRRRRADENDLIFVRMLNATPEPDGSIKEYWLRAHPECRPMSTGPRGEVLLGEPQKLTALNAIASTFGMTGEDYSRVAVNHFQFH